MKAAGRQESVYLETYFITFRSLFARPSHGISGCHELTSIRYAIFAAGLAFCAARRAPARLYATLRADSRNDLLFRIELHGARPYVFRFVVYISVVLLSEHQRAEKHLSEPHAAAIHKWNALLPTGEYICISQSMCHGNYSDNMRDHFCRCKFFRRKCADSRAHDFEYRRANTGRVIRSRGIYAAGYRFDLQIRQRAGHHRCTVR